MATLLPFVGRTDPERRVAIHAAGPVWAGDEVWLILGGGAISAALPPLAAVSFSRSCLAMLVARAALILRPVAFKSCSERDQATWRARRDWALCVGGTAPPAIFGVAIGKVARGAPFRRDQNLMATAAGAFLARRDPLSPWAGLTALATAIFMPPILLCTAQVRRAPQGKVDEDAVARSSDSVCRGEKRMRCFARMLGPPLAAIFAAMNATWREIREDDLRWRDQQGGAVPARLDDLDSRRLARRRGSPLASATTRRAGAPGRAA